MTEVQLILSDIDGTLLASNHQPLLSTIHALRAVTAKGIPFLLASARSPAGMSALATQFGLATPMICYNGALIVNSPTDFATRSDSPLPRPAFLHLLDLLEQFPGLSLNVYIGMDWFVTRMGPRENREAQITGLMPDVVPVGALRAVPARVHKVLMIGDPLQLKQLAIALAAIPELQTTMSKRDYLEIVAAGIDKLSALKSELHRRGLTADAVMTLGDNFNDLPMLAFAKHGTALGNAPLAVQQAAAHVTADNDNDGIALALTKYVL